MTEPAHHITSRRTYFIVFGLLLILMGLTVGAHFVEMGSTLNIMVALTIAVAKTALIVLFFMHVRLSSKLVQLFAGAAFFWVVIMFVLILADYMVRGWPPPGLFNFAS